MSISIPGFTLGIIGGGQLGRMMAIEARRLGIRTAVLDPSPEAPAAGIADELVVGSLQDASAIQKLSQRADVITYEIEHINLAALVELEADNVILRPRPAVLEIIQDKFRQKQFLLQRNLPVPRLWAERPGSYPIVQKVRQGGYDGRGVTVLHSAADTGLNGPVFYEEAVTIKTELAVLLARSAGGDLAVYPLIEMVFDPRAQICSSVAAPARVSSAIADQAKTMAVAAIEALDGVGIFAVELFLTTDDRVLINEIAPRPHNSGHWTIEGALTNQFEQHIRAVCGLPLGRPDLIRPSVMINLLGEIGATGKPRVTGYEAALAVPGLAFHWYQKTSVTSLRKMGHVTISHDQLPAALALAETVQASLKINGTSGGAS